ncbi:sigma-70 family RNA polymerase sigma factor [Aquabacterium sp.]|uniref:sigma-70 family RNA polymerase sigma factor n=1 Tax=Aquabacterium sp. TaxID=1872578 RepID=UPI003D6D648D
MSLSSTELTLGEVFVANRAYLRRVAQKIVHTVDLADEVIQDAYLKLIHGGIEREIRKPLCYCCQVVRNMAFDYHRQRAVESNYRICCDDVEAIGPVSCNLPELTFRGRQALELVDKVLGALAPRTRLAFELNRLNGLTQREIGGRLGCSATLVNFMIKEAETALSDCRYLL